MLERTNKLLQKFHIEKENIYPFSIAIIISAIFFIGLHYLGDYFFTTMWLIIAVILAILMLEIMRRAGFAVLKSLFEVSAGLSLLILLAQTYCTSSIQQADSSNALKSLFTFGLIYSVFLFFGHLRKELKENYKKVEKEKWRKEKIITVTLFLIFIGLFLWEIYLVMKPIIFSLCVYK
jgi:hypothetical protein